MINYFSKLFLFLGSAWASEVSQKMRSPVVNSLGLNDSSVALEFHTVSTAQLYLRYGIAGAGILCGFAALWFFYRSAKVEKENFEKRKRLFLYAVVLFIAGLMLFFIPKIFFQELSYPVQFDPRTT